MTFGLGSIILKPMKIEFQELQDYVGPRAKIEVCDDWLRSIGYPVDNDCGAAIEHKECEIFEYIKKNAFNKMDDLLDMVKERGFKTVRGKDFTYLNLRNFLISKGYANLSQLKRELRSDEGCGGVEMTIEDLNE